MAESSIEPIYLGSKPSAQLASYTPYKLRALILDYLCHECYANTAKAFLRETTVRHFDADGDEVQPNLSRDVLEDDLKQVDLRQQIREHILRGEVEEATLLLNKHFPSVLSGPVPDNTPNTAASDRNVSDAIPFASATSVDPAHLTLNLRILSFIEACRTIPLPYPNRNVTVTHSTPPDSARQDSSSNLEQQFALLKKAQKLLGLANTLVKESDRVLYTEELKNVGGLLAYKVPEHSSISRYLSQERREAVADQLNRAILDRCGSPPVSSLELLARYTSAVWSFARELGVRPRPGICLPPTTHSLPSQGKEAEIVPRFDLQEFLEAKA